MNPFNFWSKRKNTNLKENKPEMSTKNKWLYTTDSFGKLERGVSHDSESFKTPHP